MAERFSDPLFEKVGELSIIGYCIWMEYFEMEEKSSPNTQPEQQRNELIKYFEGRGGHVF